jgi:hypothetical protein
VRLTETILLGQDNKQIEYLFQEGIGFMSCADTFELKDELPIIQIITLKESELLKLNKKGNSVDMVSFFN